MSSKEERLEDLEYKLEHLIGYKRDCEEEAEGAKIEIEETKKEINQLEREITYE
jgi:peptidoglycan hydrolase CwlO-like protein